MKNAIVAMFFMVLFLGCHESNSVEPILDSSDQMNRMDNITDDVTLNLPGKGGNSKEVKFVGNSKFNPDKKCGKVIYGTLKYTPDNEVKEEFFVSRYFYNVKVEAPSQMVINNKTCPTKNIYIINRVEKVTKLGKVISGKTWGTFQIHQMGGHNPAIFQGEFTGEIEFKTANIKLKGKGVRGNYLGRVFKASEQQVCTASGGELHCWTSNMEGSILPRITIDD